MVVHGGRVHVEEASVREQGKAKGMQWGLYEVDHCTAFGPCSACGITPSSFLVCGEQKCNRYYDYDVLTLTSVAARRAWAGPTEPATTQSSWRACTPFHSPCSSPAISFPWFWVQMHVLCYYEGGRNAMQAASKSPQPSLLVSHLPL